jgi:integrase
MPGRRAKILSPADVNDLLLFASCTGNPLRNRVIVLLSAKAGLRAREIANLTWDMVLGPTGQISGIIELRLSASPCCSACASSAASPAVICTSMSLPRSFILTVTVWSESSSVVGVGMSG